MLGPTATTAGSAACRCAAGWAAGTRTRCSTTRSSICVKGRRSTWAAVRGVWSRDLIERGVPALGVDQSATAVGLARRSGAPALRRDVFDPLPGTGRWQTVLLADGNVGLGGDPRRVLRRSAELLRHGGRCIAEFDTVTTGVDVGWVRLESARDDRSVVPLGLGRHRLCGRHWSTRWAWRWRSSIRSGTRVVASLALPRARAWRPAGPRTPRR